MIEDLQALPPVQQKRVLAMQQNAEYDHMFTGGGPVQQTPASAQSLAQQYYDQRVVQLRRAETESHTLESDGVEDED